MNVWQKPTTTVLRRGTALPVGRSPSLVRLPYNRVPDTSTTFASAVSFREKFTRPVGDGICGVPFHLWPLYSVASSFFVLFTAFSNLTWQRRFFLYAVMSICEGVGFQRIRRWLLERLYFPRQDSVFWNKGARRSPWPLAKCESNWIH